MVLFPPCSASHDQSSRCVSVSQQRMQQTQHHYFTMHVSEQPILSKEEQRGTLVLISIWGEGATGGSSSLRLETKMCPIHPSNHFHIAVVLCRTCKRTLVC